MYNLAKILTEEPEKIEKLLILFSKLIITFFLTSAIYGFNFTFSSIVENPVPKDLTTARIIYFFVTTVIVWYVTWDVLLGGILTALPLWLITKKRTGKGVFDLFLSLLDVAYPIGTEYNRGKNIIDFTNILKKREEIEEIGEMHSRFMQYYQLSFVVLLSLLFFTDVNLPGWTIYFLLSFIAGFFLLSIVFSLAHKYITENRDLLIQKFNALTYANKVSNAIKENTTVKLYYGVTETNLEVNMFRNSNDERFPFSINVLATFHRFPELANAQLENIIRTHLIDQNEPPAPPDYIIVFSNITPSDSLVTYIKRTERLIFVTAKTQSEILVGFEEALKSIGVPNPFPLRRID